MSDACRPAASTRLSSSWSGRQPWLRRAWLVRSRTSRSIELVPPPPDGGGGGSSGVVSVVVGGRGVLVVVRVVDGLGFTVSPAIVGRPLGLTVTVTTPPGAEVTTVLGAVVAVDVVVDSADPSVGVPIGAIVVVTPFGSVLVTVTSGLPGLP